MPEKEADLLKNLMKKDNIESLSLKLNSSKQKRNLELIPHIIKAQKCLKHISLSINGNFGFNDQLLKDIGVVLQNHPLEQFDL